MPPIGNAVTELNALAEHSILCCHVPSHDDTRLHHGRPLPEPVMSEWWLNWPVRIAQIGHIRQLIINRLDDKWREPLIHY